jgi:hypothetical protein
MKLIKKGILFGVVAALSACSSSDDFFFPEAGAQATTGARAVMNSSVDVAVAYDSTSFMSKKIEASTREINDFKAYVDGRKNTSNAYAEKANQILSEYRMQVSQINARLQAGTTPNNPELLDMWKVSRTKLESINDVAFDLKRYAQDVESDLQMVNYFVSSIKDLYLVGGATESQHATLKTLEAQVKDMEAGIKMMVKTAEAESQREQAYVESQKNSLADLALNIREGKIYSVEASNALTSQGFADFANVTSAANAATITSVAAKGRSIFTINFDKNVKYQEPLFQAMNRALERNPQARFDLVVVTPKRLGGKSSSAAERNAADVLKTLTEMGLPTNRIDLSTAVDNVTAEEIQIFSK